eukprot:6196281-Pleurochrysis_carterae.AAC.1
MPLVGGPLSCLASGVTPDLWLDHPYRASPTGLTRNTVMGRLPKLLASGIQEAGVKHRMRIVIRSRPKPQTPICKE